MKTQLGKSNPNWKSLVGVALSAVTLLLFSNIAFSNYHLKKVLDTVERTETVMESYSSGENLYSTENTGCYRSELGRVYCGTELDNWVRDVVVKEANKSYTDLSVEKYKLNQIMIFPFGRELREPIDRYNFHIDSWLDFYKDVGSCYDYSCYYKEKKKPKDISSSFRMAEDAFAKVIPNVDLFESQDRIIEVFKN